jgi:hypothetical protein
MTPSASPLARSTIHRLYLTSAFGEQHEEALCVDEVGETRDREGDNGGGGVSRNAGSPGMQASDGICSAPPRLASGRAATAFPALPAGDVTVARRDMRDAAKALLDTPRLVQSISRTRRRPRCSAHVEREGRHDRDRAFRSSSQGGRADVLGARSASRAGYPERLGLSARGVPRRCGRMSCSRSSNRRRSATAQRSR